MSERGTRKQESQMGIAEQQQTPEALLIRAAKFGLGTR